MSTRPQVRTTSSATPEPGIDGVMVAIGLELARLERGAQSEADTCSRIALLVSAGKQLMLAAETQR
jgi:hypothetical protein